MEWTRKWRLRSPGAIPGAEAGHPPVPGPRRYAAARNPGILQGGHERLPDAVLICHDVGGVVLRRDHREHGAGPRKNLGEKKAISEYLVRAA
ncbi:MAG: hypothetical protein HW377_2011 [Actinobacteria bacterium]|nr:hypothetical protein [Actinomycetota bacterium]